MIIHSPLYSSTGTGTQRRLGVAHEGLFGGRRKGKRGGHIRTGLQGNGMQVSGGWLDAWARSAVSAQRHWLPNAPKLPNTGVVPV